jgi:hypothetical protein
MSKKTLPDELRSVLLAHSLDAPEPDDTADRILAATVGAVAADEAGRRGPFGRPGERWWTSSQLLGAAVVIALLVLGAGGFALHNRGTKHDTASGSSAGQAYQRGSGPASRPSTGLGQLQNGPNKAQSALAEPAPPTDLPCTSVPGGRPVVGAHTNFTLTSTGQLRYVYEFLCVGTNGARSASELQVFQPGPNGRLSYLSTLVPASKEGHLEYLVAVPNGVRVQGTDQSGQIPGDVVSITYTTADGGLSFTSTGKLIAKACQRSDLTARVVVADGGLTGQHEVLQLTNLSVAPCALEGYPNLVALVNGAPSGPMLNPTLSGPAGGVTTVQVPPIVVLIPGGTAGAIIELASEHPTCAPANQLAVRLPNGTSLGPIPADLSTCGLDVHPLVDNPYGTD